ncbi:hypothetical protein QQ045_020112 [Rhodiola kirilowii]
MLLKNDALEANRWCLMLPVYSISKATLNAYTRVLAKKYPSIDWCHELCSNSVAFDPDNSSKRTTPNAYTSDLSDTSPVWEYSEAKYLQDSIKGYQQCG